MTFTFKREGKEWKILQLISQPMKCNQNVPEALKKQGDQWYEDPFTGEKWFNECERDECKSKKIEF